MTTRGVGEQLFGLVVGRKANELITITDQPQEELDALATEVYPNPSVNRITIVYPYTGQPVKFIISNPEDQQLISRTIRKSKTLLNVQSLKPGIWFLRFESEDRVEVRKLIVQ